MGLISKLLIGLGMDTKGLDSGVRRSKKKLGGFQKSVNSISGSIVKSLGAIGAGFAIGSVISDSLSKIQNFEQGVANLASISGKSAKQISALVDNAKKVGAVSSFSATEVIGLQTELAKLGNTEGQIISMTKSVVDFSVAVGTTAEEAAAFAGGTLNGFGKSANESTAVLNTLALATTKSALDFGKLNEALPKVAVAAKQSGVSLERTTAILGILSNTNIKASKSGNSLKNIFLILKEKGLTYEGAMQKINNSTDSLNEANEIFGRENAIVAATLAESTVKVDELEKAITGADGALKKMTDTRLNTAQGKAILLTSAWEGLVLSVDSGNGVISDATKGFYELGTSIISAATDANNGTSTWESFFSAVFNPKQKQQADIAKVAIEKYTTSLQKLSQSDFEKDSAKISKALFNLYVASGSSAKGAAFQVGNFFKTVQGGFDLVKAGKAVVPPIIPEGTIKNLDEGIDKVETFKKRIDEVIKPITFGIGKISGNAGLLEGDKEQNASLSSNGENATVSNEYLIASLTHTETLTEAQRLLALSNNSLGDSYIAMGEAMGASLAAGASGFREFANLTQKAATDIIAAQIKIFVASELAKTSLFTSGLGLVFAPVIAGLAAGVFKTAINSLSVPALAEGGVVSGPRIVQVGEYAGASTNPEIIAPEKKLTSIFSGVLARQGGGGGELFGELRGSDLLLSNKREQSVRKRTAYT